MAQNQNVLQIHQILGKHIVLAVVVWLGGYQLGSFRSRRVWEEKQPLHKKVKTQACPTKWATARGPFLLSHLQQGSCEREPLNLETEKSRHTRCHHCPQVASPSHRPPTMPPGRVSVQRAILSLHQHHLDPL